MLWLLSHNEIGVSLGCPAGGESCQTGDAARVSPRPRSWCLFGRQTTFPLPREPVLGLQHRAKWGQDSNQTVPLQFFTSLCWQLGALGLFVGGVGEPKPPSSNPWRLKDESPFGAGRGALCGRGLAFSLQGVKYLRVFLGQALGRWSSDPASHQVSLLPGSVSPPFRHVYLRSLPGP